MYWWCTWNGPRCSWRPQSIVPSPQLTQYLYENGETHWEYIGACMYILCMYILCILNTLTFLLSEQYLITLTFLQSEQYLITLDYLAPSIISRARMGRLVNLLLKERSRALNRARTCHTFHHNQSLLMIIIAPAFKQHTVRETANYILTKELTSETAN